MDAFAPWHLIIVAAAFVVFFGWKKLPEMSGSLGRSLRIFKTEVTGMQADDEARAVRAAVQETVADARAELVDTTAAVRAVPTPSGVRSVI